MRTTKLQKRNSRRRRIRAVISGTAKRPRLAVFRSLRGMYAQLIDDETSKTVFSAHTKTDVKEGDAKGRTGKTAKSYLLGMALAKKAVDAKITAVVFDRAGYRYHGRVQAFADGAREGGLKF